MQNILYLLARFGAHILFIGLEILCFYFIVNFNKTQKDIYLNSASLFAGKLNEKVDNVRDYMYLQEINDSLQQENSNLLETMINSNTRKNLNVSILDTQLLQYELIPSSICSKTIHLRNNFFTLCDGKNKGITKGMGVISKDGIVGVVSNASYNYSKVLPLINSLSHISAAIKNKNFFGTLTWTETNPLKMTMEEVPKHAGIAEGDTIITSGYSTHFPKGIEIGTIENFIVDRGSANYTIEVNLFNDLTNLEYVYVINNHLATEQDSLQNASINE